jgi:hypothetical protein
VIEEIECAVIDVQLGMVERHAGTIGRGSAKLRGEIDSRSPL